MRRGQAMMAMGGALMAMSLTGLLLLFMGRAALPVLIALGILLLLFGLRPRRKEKKE